MIQKYNPQSEKRYTPVQLGEISKICKLCDYEPDCKEHDAAIRKDERDKVLKQMEERLIESCSENYEPSGMGCKCCPFLIVYDEGLECAIAKHRQKDGER